jgi:hypothetical protein
MSRFSTGSSTLLATTNTGWRACGGARRCGVLFGDAHGDVGDQDEGVGLGDGLLALAADLLVERASRPGIQPPVSTRRKRCPVHSASTSLRSRVTPGSSSTMASRRPMMRLSSVDLPTLGRPMMATMGRVGHGQASRARRRAAPWVGMISTGRGRSAGVVPSRNGHPRGTRRAAGSGVHGAPPPSTSPRSWPTNRPVTEVVPPKKRFGTEHHGRRSGSRPPMSGSEHRGPRFAGEHGGGGSSVGAAARRRWSRRDRSWRTAQPGSPRLALRSRCGLVSRVPGEPSDRSAQAKKPGVGEVVDVALAPELELEGPRHADAVFVHGEALVGARRGEGPTSEQVVLVGGVHESAPEHRRNTSCQSSTQSITAAASSASVARMRGSVLKREMPRGTTQMLARSG